MARTWKEVIAPKFMEDADELYEDYWMKQMDQAWVSDDGIQVYSRMLDTGKFTVEHVVITSKIEKEISWLTKQHIKNDLFGSQKEAIELYPAELGRCYTEGTYHLWIPASDVKQPFGLDKTKLRPVSRNKVQDPNGFMLKMARIFGLTEEVQENE